MTSGAAANANGTIAPSGTARRWFSLVAVVRDEEAMSPKQRTSCAPLRHVAGAHASDWRQFKRRVEACEKPVLTAALDRKSKEYQ